MAFSLISLNIGKEKKNNEPLNVICHPKPSVWRGFIEFIQILTCLVSICGIGFAVFALKESKKASQYAAESLKKAQEVFQFENRPVLSTILSDDYGLAIKNTGRGPIESLKGVYRVLYVNEGMTVLGENGYYRKILESDEAVGLRLNLTAAMKDPKNGFLFVLVRIDSSSISKPYVKIFYKILGENRYGWYETDQDLWNLSQDHREMIFRQLRDLGLRF
jgi:hypothetical protein